MIAWPRGPYRVRPERAGAGLAFRLFFTFLVAAAILAMCLSVMVRQPVLNLLVTMGAGETIEGVRRDWIHCWGPGAGSKRIYHCHLEVTLPSGRVETIFMYSASDLGESGVGRIARIGGELGVGLSDGDILSLLVLPLSLLAVMGYFLYRGLKASWRRLEERRVARLAREGRIVDADLLRKVNPSKGTWAWDYAFDHGGRRHYARSRLALAPAQTDPVETRGGALVAPDGRSHLLDVELAPLDVPDQEVHKLNDHIVAECASAAAHRTPALERLIAQTPEGPRRQFLQAWIDAWTPDPQATAAARERRHGAAIQLSREEVDELLRRARDAARP